MTTALDTEHGEFVHPALFYSTEAEYVDGLVPFLTEGLASGQPVAAAVPRDNLSLLRTALGRDAERVLLVDMTEAGRNPGRIIPGVLRAFADQHPKTHVRIIGEPIWPGRTATEYPACVQHEALINASFASRDATILCPYDAARLDQHILDDAEATHPLLRNGGRERTSERYAPDSVVAHYNQPLNGATGTKSCEVTAVGELAHARRFADEEATRLGLDPDRQADLHLIVTELVTNSLIHGGGSSRLRIWRDADAVICEVWDDGQLTDPLAGRRPADDRQLSGRGLLLINHLADLVRVHTSPHGTTFRIWLRLGRA